jgi:hypothetical protein
LVISYINNLNYHNMKRWKIEIIATDEAQASKILKSMSDCFETARKFNLPLVHISMDAAGINEMSTCELIKE